VGVEVTSEAQGTSPKRGLHSSRVSRAALLLLVLLSPLPLVLGAAENPFAGWEEKKIEGHKKAAKSRIAAKLRRWQTARKALVFRCASCQGGGRVLQRRGRVRRVVDCPTCKATGACISRDKFKTVFWELRSPHYRSSKDRMRELEELFKKARADPKKAVDFLEQITKWRRKSIEVKGNHAIIVYTEKQQAVEAERKQEWIEVDKKWWLAHEEVDAGFVRHTYTSEGETTPKRTPPPEPGSRPKPPKKEPAPPKKEPPPKPEPKPKKPLEDPDKLFRATAPKITHVEENAWKVFGQITNITKERRFAYLIVTVSLYKGDRLVDTTECNVGTVILKPGGTATYSGYLYADKLPNHDRKVATVSKYEELE